MSESPPSAELPTPQQRRRAVLRRSLSLVAALGLIGAILWADRQRFAELRLAEPWLLLPLVGLQLCSAWARGQVFRSTLAPLDVELQRDEAFALAAGSRLLDLVLPMRAGVLARATYLARVHRVPLPMWASNTAIIGLLAYGAAALLLLLAMGWRAFLGQTVPWVLLAGALAVLAALAVLLAWAPELPRPARGGLVLRLWQALEGWRLMLRDRASLARSVGWSGLGILLGGLCQWLAFRLISAPVALADAFSVAVVSTLSGLVALTPGGLGLREALMGFTSSLLGYALSHGVASGLVLALTHVVALGLVAPWTLRRLLRAREVVA